VHTSQALDQGRLAGAVVAEQRVHGPWAHLEIDIHERPDAGECLRDVTQPERELC
jgi:hypothetical protein